MNPFAYYRYAIWQQRRLFSRHFGRSRLKDLSLL